MIKHKPRACGIGHPRPTAHENSGTDGTSSRALGFLVHGLGASSPVVAPPVVLSATYRQRPATQRAVEKHPQAATVLPRVRLLPWLVGGRLSKGAGFESLQGILRRKE